MNRSVFRAALRASAKVALGAAVVACGGAIGTTAEQEQPDARASSDASPGLDATSADAASREAMPTEAAACDPPSPSSVLPEGAHADAAAAITESTFDCCVSLLEAVPPDDSGLELPDAALGDPQVRDCCAAVIARLDHDYSEQGSVDASQSTLIQDIQASGSIRWACCAATSAEGPTCTPWGPPMPPAMPGEVA